MNKSVAVYDNTVNARTYLSYIAEQAGGYACIGRDGKLYIKTIGEETVNLDIEKFQDFTWGEKFKISRIAYEDGIRDFKFGDTTNNTVWINQENMYIVDEEQVENIYNELNNFECYSFEGNSIIDPAIDTGDIVIIDSKKVIFQGDMEYLGKFKASISSKIQTKSKEETMTRILSQKVINRRVQSQIDQENAKIEQLIEETSEYEERIVEVEQDVLGIRQEVESVIEFERSVTGKNQILLENTADINDSILKIQIKGNMNYVYPSSTTYPSNTLYPIGQYATIVIDKQEKGNISNEAYKFKIVLLQPIRYMNSSVFDEILFEDKKCQVIRRVGLDNNGNYYELSSEQITEVGDVNIPSFDGNTYIYVLEHNGLDYDVDYLVKNAYLDTFATKVELNTQITQTETEIMSKVSRKVGEDEFGTLIEQNAEAVKFAWNQFSQYLQMEILNGKASLVIRDTNGNLLMSLDQNGQHYYTKKDNVDTNIAETILTDITQNNDTKKSLMFVLDNISMNGKGIMAWGYKANNQIYPVLYIGNFGNEEFGLHVIEDLILKGCAINFGNSNTINSTDSANIYVKPNTGFYVINSNNKMLLKLTNSDGQINIGNSSIVSDGNNVSIKTNGLFKILSSNNNWITQVFEDSGEYGFSCKADAFAILNTSGNKTYISFYDNQAGSKTLNLFENTLVANSVNATSIYATSIYADNLPTIDNINWINVSASSSSGLLTVSDKSSNISAFFQASWTSDGRLKENFETSDVDSLKLINAIKHYSFDWKGEDKHEKIGYIAQELEKIDKDFVIKHEIKDENENVVDYDWTINERYIIANLTNAIQQQQEQIDYLYEQLKIEKKKNKKKKEKIKFDYGEKVKVHINSKINEIKKKFENLKKGE